MKSYVKPELFYESFEMNQSIAACGIDRNQSDKIACESVLDGKFWLDLGGMTVFGEGRTDCMVDIGDIDVYCYTVGTNEAGRVFNS